MSQKRLRLEDEPFYLVRSLAGAVPAGHVIAVHAHGWHQLIYACSGVMQVWTERGAWVVPPHWAVWVPAGMRHGIRFAAASALRTLYVDPGAGLVVPTGCSVVGVSALLRALIERAVENGALDRRVAAAGGLAGGAGGVGGRRAVEAGGFGCRICHRKCVCGGVPRQFWHHAGAVFSGQPSAGFGEAACAGGWGMSMVWDRQNAYLQALAAESDPRSRLK